MIRLLAKSIREYKRDALLTPLFVTLEVIIECIIPFLTANLVLEIQNGCELSTIVRYGVILMVLAGFSLFFGRIAGTTAASASAGYARNLRRDMFYNIQNFSFANIDRFSTSSLVTRMTTDVTNVQMAFMMIIRGAIRFPLMLVFSFIMAYIMGGSMAFIFLFTIPVLAIGLAVIICKVHPLFVKVFRKYDTLNNSIQENVQAMRVVKSYVREDFEKEKFSTAAEDVCRDFTRAERIMAFNSPLMQFCLYSATCLILGLGAYFIISTQGVALTVGKLSSLFVYSFQILVSLMMLSMVFVMITISAESAHRIVEVLQERSTITSPANAVMEVKDGSIDFDGVDFKYSADAERDALSQINLHIRSGETVGILGGTGSSKSSLIQLIPRLYDATQGTVRVGGVDVRDYDLDSLRNAVSVVLQKNVLFSGTILENLRWGKEDATLDECAEACRLACADTFIQQFPKGYDTWIEQGGSNVSGGQKQRLCIARALLKHPKILILDDSTSAVDTATDAKIRRAFSEELPGTTKLIIAQRISSVQDADRIIVLDGDTVNGFDTHENLLKTNAIYREIYEAQTQGGGDFDEGAGA